MISKEPQGDVGTFKLTADNSARGADYLVVNTAAQGAKIEVCRPGKNPGDQIAQHRHLAVWLRSDDRPGAQFVVQLPKTARVEGDRHATLIRLEDRHPPRRGRRTRVRADRHPGRHLKDEPVSWEITAVP